MPDDQGKQEEEDFEEAVSALLKVDPEGLSGKHRKPSTRENESDKKSKESD